MSLRTFIKTARDTLLEKFTGYSPIAPQVLIGLGCITAMPWIIATNKKEKPEKRIESATITLARESIALPVSLAIATLSGWAGSNLAKNPLNKLGLGGVFATLGYVAANLTIPFLNQKILHKYPIIREKVNALAVKKGYVKNPERKLDVVSYAPEAIKGPTVFKSNRYVSSPQVNPFINYQTPISKPEL